MTPISTSVGTPTCRKPSAAAISTSPATMSHAPGSAGSTTPARPSATTVTPVSHSATVTGVGPPDLLASALLRKLRLEPLLHVFDRRQIALGIHEPVRIVGVARLVFLVEPELARVRGQEHVHRDGLLGGERARVV